MQGHAPSFPTIMTFSFFFSLTIAFKICPSMEIFLHTTTIFTLKSEGNERSPLWCKFSVIETEQIIIFN
ncbi:Uncharacterized protein TCM_035084 [Theobroma cacao]|uniref:Uncharacterized protein n=1 Tax=Theobroma cacao TaxID=3641 RepID=A0A061FH71_THECC|nr:Uncharacterized protein TCM_035084 [Theobroma cacao]